MTAPAPHPPAPAINAILDALGHSRANYSLDSMPGSYSNFTSLLRIQTAAGHTKRVVLRRYHPQHIHEGHDKPACEYHALKLLRNHAIPTPAPLLLDADGTLLGAPGIVTEFVEGRQIAPPADPARWEAMAAANARMLARIHQTPFTDADKPLLMDDDTEVAWFIKNDKLPDYMRRDPDGPTVWQLVHERWKQRDLGPARFLHTDYWSGNILWRSETISAVLDWEEAGYGDPATDVAYARMEYFLEGLPTAAETFLQVYQSETGWPLPNLPISELAASARPMTDPKSWFTRPNMQTRFRQFIATAKHNLTS